VQEGGQSGAVEGGHLEEADHNSAHTSPFAFILVRKGVKWRIMEGGRAEDDLCRRFPLTWDRMQVNDKTPGWF